MCVPWLCRKGMSFHKLLKYRGKLGISHIFQNKNYQQTCAQNWAVRGCCHFTLGAEPPFNNSWFVGFCSCGWGFQKRDPWHPCSVRPFPACGRPTPLRGQEIWWTWCPISLPEVLPLNFPFALSWSSIKCINLMELVLVNFVWIEWSVPTCLCLEDNWLIWYTDLFLRQEVWVEVGGWGRGGECPWVEGLLQLGCYSSQLCVVGTMGMHIPVFTQGK